VTPPNVSSINWVTSGVTWPTVYDQQSCGAGYAFASVGALEGAYYQQSQVSLHLSVQQLVTCSGVSGNQGCRGGTPESSFNYWEDTPA